MTTETTDYAKRVADTIGRFLAVQTERPYLESDPQLEQLCQEYLTTNLDLRQFFSRVLLYSRVNVPMIESVMYYQLAEYVQGIRLTYRARSTR